MRAPFSTAKGAWRSPREGDSPGSCLSEASKRRARRPESSCAFVSFSSPRIADRSEPPAAGLPPWAPSRSTKRATSASALSAAMT